MRCKACNNIVTSKNKRVLDPDKAPHHFEEDEDLCNDCLGVAQNTFIGYNASPEEREEDLKRFFYRQQEQEDVYTIAGKIMEDGSIPIDWEDY